MADRRSKADPAPRKRALVSCDRCKLRRARCIRDNPDEACADCKISGVRCESKLPRKQRVYGSVETLSLRYRALEALVKGLFPQENLQDTDTIFHIAASRNISMPERDDFTPADIFSKGGSSQQHESNVSQSQQSTSKQAVAQPTQLRTDSRQSGDPTSPVSTAKDGSQRNPFSEAHHTSPHQEELIPTKHGVPHYFGPSSSFRLAMTIRSLAARYKDTQSTDFASKASGYLHTDAAIRPGNSMLRGSANPSDEEYTVYESKEPLLTSERRNSRKRSRIQMEETSDRWERHDGEPNPDTIGDLLPSRSLADALVIAYFDYIHVYLPLFDRSMFQFRLEATYSRKTELLQESTDIGWLIVLALVFSFGCQQLHEHDPEQSHKLRLKYLSFVKTYFRHLLTNTCLVNVQALVLLNVHHHTVGQKSSSWLLIGLAARMAITLGMHRDGTNAEFDPIERNTRRQVWWSIYTFEKMLCSILGRPTVIDDAEMSMKIPETPMLEQRSTSGELMTFGLECVRLSYRIRQEAYFDKVTCQERTPTVRVAESLLKQCDDFIATIPEHLSLNYSPVPPDQKSRILLLHIYYFYMRCMVSRDFLIQKVERDVCQLEGKSPPFSEDWDRTMLLSEDCVESAHKSIQCIMAGSTLGMIGVSWLDLFYIVHSVLIVCADFLARPKGQTESRKDIERKETVRAMLNHVGGMRQLAPTYTTLVQIAMQFASITGVAVDASRSRGATRQPNDPNTDTKEEWNEEVSPPAISDVPHDWFSNATTSLGLDFFDLQQAGDIVPVPVNTDPSGYPGFFIDPATNDVDEWTARTLRGMNQ